mmetsp:Transcript_58143/g.80675  ORF Transcript_58143/g.80675 Transcript_58143/m.80675 type:complete len:155 (+) Transcript_58143:65-529(+)|eukprot:symbB.v1.2.019506.t1/scaffold1557.1/size112825/5
MDQTPARPRRSSTCFLDETPGKVSRPKRELFAETDPVKETKIPSLEPCERGKAGKAEIPKEGTSKIGPDPTKGSETEMLKLTIQDGADGNPTFEMDGATYRVLDTAALLQVGTISSNVKKPLSIAEFKRQRRAQKHTVQKSEADETMEKRSDMK